jgi:hypothetical protein
MFLMTVFAHRKQSAPLMPLLICVRHESNYVCVGVDPQDTKSEFVFRFRSACALTAVQIQLNSFDFALAQVPAASFETWSTALLGGDNAGDGVDDYESDPSDFGEDEEQPDEAETIEDIPGIEDVGEEDEDDLITSQA